MAKKITKNINAKFNPTLLDGYNIYNYGGRMRYDIGGMMMPGGMLDMSQYMGQQQDMTKTGDVDSMAGIAGNLIEDTGALLTKPGNVNWGGNIGKGAAMGAAAGSVIPVIGTGVGAAIGAAGGAAKSLLQKKKIEAEQQSLREQNMANRSQQLISNLPGQSSYVPTFEMGGNMNMMGGNKEILDRVSSVESNTTHEQSPYGGVPISNNALVEKDEYLYTNKAGKKYVFSNKLFRQ